MLSKFLLELKQQGIKLYLKEDNLLFKAAKNSLTEELKSTIKSQKKQIVNLLKTLNTDSYSIRLPSYAQQRLWFIDQLEQGGNQYNLPGAFRIAGLFDKDAFETAIREIINRHEVLRTNILSDCGQPIQVVYEHFDLPICYTDLSLLDTEQQAAEIRKLEAKNAQQAFDISKDLMLRIHVLKLQTDIHHMIFNMHHIASDGWSMGVLINEFTALYSAFSKREKSPLAPLALQYSDYAQWQRELLTKSLVSQELEYWQKKLAGIPEVHSLPLSKVRPVKQSLKGYIVTHSLSSELRAQLRAMCNKESTTLFMLLHTMFALMISRYSNEKDVVTGTVVSGRMHKDIEDLIGFFVNTLVLRTEIDNRAKFTELLQQNKQWILDAFEHQKLPFEMLVEDFKSTRALSHSPLVQVMFALESESLQPQSGVQIMADETKHTSSKFDLVLRVIDEGDKLRTEWTYATDLFENSLIESMAAGYEAMLEQLIAVPASLVADLQPISVVDRNILAQWQNVGLEAVYVPEMFYGQVCHGIVVDSEQRLVPIGVQGQLFLVGENITSAYLSCIDEQQKHFVVDPTNPQQWMYDTNQRVRYSENGVLHYCGPANSLVKVKGVQINLLEVCEIIAANEYIHSANVTVDQSQPEAALVVLVAPVSKPDDNMLFLKTLHSWLKTKLPNYMLPNGFVLVEPGVMTEQADLSLLPEAIWLEENLYEEPESETERKLATLWEELLAVDKVGLNDNFFVLGGNSLSAVRLEFSIQEAFSISVSVRDIFENSTLASLARLIENCTQGREEVIPVALTTENLQLSFAQRRLWFIDQLAGNNSHHYNIPIALKLTGRLDKIAMHSAISQVIDRHHILHTVYVTGEQGEVYQAKLNSYDFELLETDLSCMADEKRTALADQLISEQAQNLFDLTSDLMLKAHLLTLSEQNYVLLLTIHHIAADGWSMGVIVKEITEGYRAKLNSSEPQLAPLSIQYSDFSAWQCGKISNNELDSQLAYWDRQLQGLPVLHELPLDKTRPLQPTNAGQLLRVPIEISTLNKLKLLANDSGSSLFMVLQTAYVALLSRWSGQYDISIGTPVSGRTHRQLAPMIGCFVNTLVLRHQMSADVNFVELLEQVKHTSLMAFEHQDVPFEMLVEKLGVERSINYSPLFQLFFTLQNNDIPDMELPGVNVSAMITENHTSKFDVSLQVSEEESGCFSLWEFNTDLFCEETINSMAQYYLLLLDAIADNPYCRILQMPLLNNDDKNFYQQQQLDFIQEKQQASNGPRCLHQRFEEQAQLWPDNVAAIFEHEQISYRQLNERANRLASYLCAHGVQTKSLVGLYVERSIDMLTGMLAILKAGATYIPLDPSYPQSRLAYMVEDAKLTFVLTQQQLEKDFFPAHVELVCLNDTAQLEAIELYSPTNLVLPENCLNSGNGAYVIYTSGSTGKPKGVLIEHGNVLSLFESCAQVYDFDEKDCWTMFHSFSFDFSVWEIWGALLFGGRLVIVSYDTSRSPVEFHKLLQVHQVTVLSQTPSAFYPLITQVLSSPAPLALRYLVFGGEALEPVKLKRWIDWFGDQKPALYNMYGITETTVHVTIRQIFASDCDAANSVIGKPLKHLSAYVCNASMALQPIGVVGELYIGGAGVAREYLNREELTNERFIVNPFAEQPPVLYRSGDLVRWVREGELEYLTRIDHQAKLRGFRIELGEIEHELSVTGLVRESTVLIKNTATGHQQIIAYIIPIMSGQQNIVEELRKRLAETLPAHMIPAAFVLLEHIPLTSNGKVNKDVLPEPDMSEQHRFVSPESDTELRLAYIWKHLLKLDKVSATASFFELGGHSLLVTKLASEINSCFSTKLSIRDLFEHSTIQTQANCIETKESSELEGIQIVARDGALPLSFAQQRLWFIDRMNEGRQRYNMPATVQLDGELDKNSLKQALNQIIARHEILRTVYQPGENGDGVQVITAPRPLDIIEHDYSKCTGDLDEKQALLIDIVSEQLFDLTKDLMLSVNLIRYHDRKHVLLFNMHHIASDGWSMDVLIREFITLYTCYQKGGNNVLAALPVQYADFAVWQRNMLQGDLLVEQMAYWHAQLADLPQVHYLPVHKRNTEQQDYRGNTLVRTLSSELTQKLNNLAGDHGVTLFMTMHAALSVLMSRWSNETDIVVGVPVAGRTHAHLSSLIGFFVNTLIFRSDLSTVVTFESLLSQSKQTALNAYENQDVPFERLVDELKADRSLGQSPLFQVMFALQNNDHIEFELPKLKLTPILQKSKFARFELTLIVREDNGQLTLAWEYMTALFDEPTIEAMAKGFEVLLAAITEDPRQEISCLPVLDDTGMRCRETAQCAVVTKSLCPKDIDAEVVTAIVIDRNSQEVPDGVEGELVLSGCGALPISVSQSDTMFFSQNNDQQWFLKTNKSAYFDANGQLLLTGELDKLVKYKGYRIHLDQLETQLSLNPYVKSSTVKMLEQDSLRYLVAYVELSIETEEPVTTLKAIRQWLKDSVPQYLMPDAYGHVRDPEQVTTELHFFEDTVYQAAETDEEKTLARIWETLLNVKNVGLQDNFFVLGGSSLTAVRLEFLINEAFEVAVSVRDIFEHPTLSELVSLITTKEVGALESIPQAFRSPAMELSAAQQRLWFIDELEGGSIHYNMPTTLKLNGQLNKQALQQALDTIIARHEILRTTYGTQNGRGYQTIHQAQSLTIAEIDISHLPHDEQLERARLLAHTDAKRPFDLTRAPMLRVTLIRLAADLHIVVFNMHHIASDGWSVGVLINEFSLLYQAYYSDQAHPLPDLKVQYADYAEWQNDWLQGESLPGYLSFWRNELDGAPTLHSLPLDRARPAVMGVSNSYFHTNLELPLSDGLEKLAAAHGATLFMVLNAAFSCLLGRMSGEQDIVLGTPIANRDNPALAPLLGCFVNTLVLRTELSKEYSFSQLLSLTKTRVLKAYEHQKMPFDMLVSELQSDRSFSHHPLFQIMLILQNNQKAEISLPGLDVELIAENDVGTEFDVTLSISQNDSGLEMTWAYSGDLFDATTIENMAGYFSVLLQGIVDAPEQNIYKLPLINPQHAKALLQQRQKLGVEYDKSVCVHQFFERQVAQRPDDIALVMGSKTLTYSQLNDRANCVAHHLIDSGVGPDKLVALYMDRSFELIIGVLGILKAGGAYLPLDPLYPDSRIQYMLEDSQVSWLITQESLVNNVPVEIAHVVVLGEDKPLSGQSTANPSKESLGLNSSHLAYVIYTSGSTGGPKGVMVSHQNVSAYLTASNAIYNVQPDDTVLQFSSPSFDIFVEELATALFCGAKLVLRNEEILAGGETFWSFIREQNISILSFTAEFWHSLCRQMTGQKIDTGCLRLLTVGGEAMSPTLLQTWRQCIDPQVTLYNVYGPTEGTAVATFYNTAKHQETDHSVSIGLPFSNHQFYVLDDGMQICPPGVKGELYLGGPSIARGYLNLEQMTNERFIVNPFDDCSSHKLYKTGDLVSVRKDGDIEFCGREDDQIKLRGYRVELREIERQLTKAEAIKSSVVTLYGEGVGRYLAAYVIPQQPPENELAFISLLRKSLGRVLPSYMIPSAFVLIDSIPMTANGKINKAALPVPDISVQHEFVEPKAGTEQKLSDIWQQLLSISKVSASASFFELGGHSLLVTKLASEINDQFQVKLSIRDLFENDTIQSQANCLTKKEKSERIAISTADRSQPLPLSFAQQRLWFIDRLEAGSQRYNMPAAVRLDGDLDKQALQMAFDQIIIRHEVLRTVYGQGKNGEGVQIITAPRALEIAEHDFTACSDDLEERQTQLIRHEAAKPFDLANELMLRVSLIKYDRCKHVLLFNMHHIASDGWSMDVLIKEFVTLYSDYLLGTESSLKALPIQYADFAVWQRCLLEGEYLAEQLTYWSEKLANLPQIHYLPIRQPRTEQQDYSGMRLVRTLSSDLSYRLNLMSAKYDVTLFMTMHAAFAVLLSRWSNETDIVVGVPVAGRTQAQLSPLVGFFINTLVFRSDMSGISTFESLLQQSKQTALDAYVHQDVPFDQLVDELKADRSFGQSPLFQVMLALQNNESAEVELPGLKLSPINQDNEFARFELTLNIDEAGECLTLSWEYMSALFSNSTIENLAAGFEQVLAAIVENPHCAINELPVWPKQGFGPSPQYGRCAVPGELCPPGIAGNVVGMIVDSHLQSVPAYVEAELILCGSEEMPDNSLVLNIQKLPENDGDLDWYYRTNLLGYYDSNNVLHITGKLDQRVKFGGYRLDLDNLAAQLSENQYVNEVCVRLENNQLVAYIEPLTETNEPEVLLRSIRQWAKSTLMSYMVPQAFAMVTSMEQWRTSGHEHLGLYIFEDIEYKAPQTEIEIRLSEIWKTLLGVDKVGVNDNFFVLGGNSLTAVRLEFSIQETFDVTISIREIFELAELGRLATLIAQSSQNAQEKIPVLSNQELIPLSFSQRRLWFIDQLEANDSHHYNVPVFLQLDGELNKTAIKNAISTIIDRHEILHTVYSVGDDGEAYQVIQSSYDFVLSETDLRCSEPVQRKAQVEQIMEAELSKPFDLAVDLMLRAHLLTLEDNSYILSLNMHHIASDGWSLGLMIKEIVALYSAYITQKELQLPALPIKYADYAAWQSHKIQQGELKHQLDYWKSKLRGLPVLHNLPLDKLRPAIPSYAGQVHHVSVDQPLIDKINKLANDNGCSLFMVLQAAFVGFLHRWSGEDDIVLGTPISGRTHYQLSSLIGFFVNTLVLRHNLSAEATFAELLNDVKQTTLRAFENQDVPFEILVEHMGVERSVNYSPLFQVLFTVQNNDIADFELPAVKVSAISSQSQTAKFDLSVQVSELTHGAQITWEYSTDLFNQDTIEQMGQYYLLLLEIISNDVNCNIFKMPLLNEIDQQFYQQQHAIFDSKNEVTLNERNCLHNIFEIQAERWPEKVAVVCGQRQLNYRLLNQQANRLAHYLCAQGVKPDDFIGLYLDRSIDLMVGMLAILKAGAAYVPLDPSYPESRLQYMVEDAGIKRVITQRNLNVDFFQSQLEFILLDDEAAQVASPYNDENSNSNTSMLTRNNAAYVIYTSGSTGKPKGVVIEHANVLALFESCKQDFVIDQNDCWTMFHSFSFDFSVWEIWGALLFGGRLVIVPFDVSRSAPDFYQLLEQQQVTVLSQTPSAFYPLINEVLDTPRNIVLKYVVFGGEALEPSKLKPWVDHYGDDTPVLYNMYGITETTVHVTLHRVLAKDCLTSSRVIGQPLSHLYAYICNPYMALQPTAVVGELYIGGEGVARGYLNRPDLTNDRFITNPFNDHPPILYRTGDLARRNKDGQLEYISRIDHQTKLRGFRIELGEIEHELAATQLVKESVVLIRESAEKHQQLVAYVVPLALEQSDLAGKLREHLTKVLPDYMVPAAFVTIEQMPITSNGKVDRRELLAQNVNADVARAKYVAPKNDLQKLICDIWSDVLEVNDVGIHDNFFAIGGDSIRVVKIIKKAHSKNIFLKVKDIFIYQTVAEVAAFYDCKKPQDQVGELPIPIKLVEQEMDVSEYFNENIEDCFPVTPLQHLMLDKHADKHRDMAVYQPIMLFEISYSEFSVSVLEQVLLYLLEKHPNLRSTFASTPQGRYVQQVLRKPKLVFEQIDLMGISNSKLAKKINEIVKDDMASGFKPGEPCIRFKLLKVRDDKWGFYISTHHAIEDGWGFVEVINDLFLYYTELEKGNPLPILTKGSNVFKEHVALNLESRKSDEYRQVWQSLLRDFKPMQAPVLVNKNADKIREVLNVNFSADLVKSLEHVAQKYNVPLKTLFLLAYQRAVMVLLETDYVVIDVVSSGRSSRLSDPFKSVGLFWNLLPICGNNEKDNEQAIKGLSRKLFDSDAYALYPIDKINEITGTDSCSYMAFNYINFHNQAKDGMEHENIQVKLMYASDCFHHVLKLSVAPGEGNEMIGMLEYSRSYFKDKTIKKLSKYLLEALVDLSD